MPRRYTCKLIELCENGTLTKEMIFDEFMCWLSEGDIQEFCETSFANEIAHYFLDLE